jgi:hypothetical protein
MAVQVPRVTSSATRSTLELSVFLIQLSSTTLCVGFCKPLPSQWTIALPTTLLANFSGRLNAVLLPALKSKIFSINLIYSISSGTNALGGDLISINMQRGRDHGKKFPLKN